MARIMVRWTPAMDEFLRQWCPSKGKLWCAKALGRSEGAIRSRTSFLGLRQDPRGEIRREGAKKQGDAIRGRKRPDQSLVIKEMRARGAFPPATAEARRATSECTKKRIAEKGHPRGMLGKHHTAEVCAQMSASRLGRKMNLSEEQRQKYSDRAARVMNARLVGGGPHPYSSARRGTRTIGGVPKFYRSRWESNYARYLQWLKDRGEIASWAHEPKTFWFEQIKRGTRSYTPDFLVIDEAGRREWHEVKGWMDDKSRVRLARMARYFPDEPLVLIGEAQYLEIRIKLGRVIPEWEP